VQTIQGVPTSLYSHTHGVFFSSQVIFRALSPPYDIENPYSAKVQEQLKITNLRVRLLKRQSCPCQINDLNAKPHHFMHYAVYDFIVKGSCFCNGHADQCLPVEGFRPIKAPGAFHVVGKTNRKLPSVLGTIVLNSLASFWFPSLLAPHPHPPALSSPQKYYSLVFEMSIFGIVLKYDN
jgi:hypothetical protein